MDIEETFWNAVYNNDVRNVLSLLASHPQLDLNVTQYLDLVNSHADATGVLREVPIVNVCFYGDISMLKILIANGADCNYRREGRDYSYPLQFAMSNYQKGVEMTRLLLQNGAVASCISNDGDTMLHELAYMHIFADQFELAEILMHSMSNAEVNTVMSHRDKDGYTAIQKARNCGLQFLAEQFENELEQRRFEEHSLLQIGLHLSYGNHGRGILNDDSIQNVMKQFHKLN